MTNNTIKIVETHRPPAENEFFFYQEPLRTAGVKELIEYLQTYHGFEIEEIPHWQIRSIVKGDCAITANHGLRISRINGKIQS